MPGGKHERVVKVGRSGAALSESTDEDEDPNGHEDSEENRLHCPLPGEVPQMADQIDKLITTISRRQAGDGNLSLTLTLFPIHFTS